MWVWTQSDQTKINLQSRLKQRVKKSLLKKKEQGIFDDSPDDAEERVDENKMKKRFRIVKLSYL